MVTLGNLRPAAPSFSVAQFPSLATVTHSYFTGWEGVPGTGPGTEVAPIKPQFPY